MKTQKGCHMIKVCRETPGSHGSKGLKHILQIWGYERGAAFAVCHRENRQKAALLYAVGTHVQEAWRKCLDPLLSNSVMKLQTISQRISNKAISGLMIKITIVIINPIYWALTVCQSPCQALYTVSSFHPHNHPMTVFQMEKLRLRGVKSNS